MARSSLLGRRIPGEPFWIGFWEPPSNAQSNATTPAAPPMKVQPIAESLALVTIRAPWAPLSKLNDVPPTKRVS